MFDEIFLPFWTVLIAKNDFVVGIGYKGVYDKEILFTLNSEYNFYIFKNA